MRPRGMYVNKWNKFFGIECDIPSTVPVWVKLPHLPLHCCSYEFLSTIGNYLGWYIDKYDPKPLLFSCAQIYVEVDLDKGLPKVINLMDNWIHAQKIDFDKFPFK